MRPLNFNERKKLQCKLERIWDEQSPNEKYELPPVKLPPPDKRRLCFLRWQKMRRTTIINKVAAAANANDRHVICACGGNKQRAMDMCYACKDMWLLIKQRISDTHTFTDKELAREPRLVTIYQAAGKLVTERKRIEDINGWQENAIRALEE